MKQMELKNFSFTRDEIIQNVLNAGLFAQIQLECVHTTESTIIANKIKPEYKMSNLS